MITRLSASLAVALLFFAAPAASQDLQPLPRNAAYLELGGNAFLYSLNVEHRVGRVWGRLGGSYAQNQDGDPFWAVPVMVATLWGEGSRRLETGAGLSLARHTDDEEAFLYGSATVGYRWIRPSGLLIRAGITPFFDVRFEEDPGLWAGVSIGWTR